MSYDITLTDPVTHETLEVDAFHQIRGGNYALYGTKELWLNVTYNYASVFYRVLGEEGIRTIYGMSGAESIPYLEKSRDALDNDVSKDYWECTEGNVKRVICSLLSFAQMRPDGIWSGD